VFWNGLHKVQFAVSSTRAGVSTVPRAKTSVPWPFRVNTSPQGAIAANGTNGAGP
jgi:hypothetical protein